MKGFLLHLLIFLLILAGAAYLLYPTVMNQVYQGEVHAVRSQYFQQARNIPADGETEMLDAAAAWNEALEREAPGDVFSHAPGRAPREYQSLLNVTDGVLALLEIPCIGVSLPVYHEGADHNPAKDLIHLKVSDLPADRAPGHVMLAGPGVQRAEGFLGDIHLTKARMLEDLGAVSPGDVLILQLLSRTLTYEVTEVQTVTAEGLNHLDLTPKEEEELLTIVTSQGDRRLLVSSRRVPVAQALPALNQEDRADAVASPLSVLLLGSPVLLLGLFIVWIIERFKRHSYRLPANTNAAALEENES